VNVDAAALCKMRVAGAVGVVCRDEHGAFLGASTRVIEGSETNFIEMSDEFRKITGFHSEAIKYHLVQNVSFKFK
jgi:hypothetical protein